MVEVSATAPSGYQINAASSRIDAFGWETDGGPSFQDANYVHTFPNDVWERNDNAYPNNWNAIWAEGVNASGLVQTVYMVTELTNEDFNKTGCVDGVSVTDNVAGLANSYVSINGVQYTLPTYSLPVYDSDC